ncbi:hypothetical protein HYT01_00860 [Candidatus Giovannonibacteria bacterium]|nr:hypothetical protein [Candidatus Giovannonibacteria bacterium]
MKYDIYYHENCLDGTVSAAVLKYFLNLRGDDFARYIPLQHPVDKNWWKGEKLKKTSAIVDILYHPGAKIWFDHHDTTFIDSEWAGSYKPAGKNLDDAKLHVFDPARPSCAGLILSSLSGAARSKIPARLREMTKWSDILDRVNPKQISVKDLLELKYPALKIGFFLDNENNISRSRQKQLINTLSKKSLADAVDLPWVKKGFLTCKKKFDESLQKMKEKLEIRGNTIFIENLERKLIGIRFAPYYFYTKANYSVRLVRHGKNFILAVGVNPWNSPKKPAEIGWFLEKNYGGGGHAYVGSAPFGSEEQARKALPDLLKYLNEHA